MKCDNSFWCEALKQKSFFASEFLKYHGPTDAKAGEVLVNYARSLNLTSRINRIPGKTLRSWISNNGYSVPLWSTKTMVRYILKAGFIPQSDEVLDSIVVILADDCSNIDELLESTFITHIEEKHIKESVYRIWHAKPIN